MITSWPGLDAVTSTFYVQLVLKDDMTVDGLDDWERLAEGPQATSFGRRGWTKLIESPLVEPTCCFMNLLYVLITTPLLVGVAKQVIWRTGIA